VPRLASGSPPTRRVDELLNDKRLSDQPWKRVPRQGRREGADGMGM
jgi:hypothetical protein